MTTETFIFVHDQDIIINYINAKKYSNLENVKLNIIFKINLNII